MVQKAFGTLSDDWFSQMYVKWVRRHEKGVTVKGEYFKKNWKKSASWHHFGQSDPHIRWCMICMYFLNLFCVCQLCKISSVICKHVLGNDLNKSATFYNFVLLFKRMSQPFWLPLAKLKTHNYLKPSPYLQPEAQTGDQMKRLREEDLNYSAQLFKRVWKDSVKQSMVNAIVKNTK